MLWIRVRSRFGVRLDHVWDDSRCVGDLVPPNSPLASALGADQLAGCLQFDLLWTGLSAVCAYGCGPRIRRVRFLVPLCMPPDCLDTASSDQRVLVFYGSI